MNRFTKHSIFLFMLLFVPSAALMAQINPNGGFETGEPGIYTGSAFSGWDFQLGGTASATFEVTTEAEFVYTGLQALKVTVDAIGTNTWEPQARNVEFQIDTLTTYSISVWAKTDYEGAVANFTFGCLESPWNEWGRKGNVALGYEWQQITFQATTRNAEPSLRGGIPIHFGLSDNQNFLPVTFYLDDVEVYIVNGTGVIDKNPPAPSDYSLAQNYPNPFNPVTTIEFSLPVSGNIRLVLSDMLGQVVQEIANGSYEAGLHQVTLNLSHLASGVYLYTLEAGSFVSTKKLVLMK